MLKRHINLFYFSITVILLSYPGFMYLENQLVWVSNEMLKKEITIMILIPLIPNILLYLEYLIRMKKENCNIDEAKSTIIICKKGKKVLINRNEVSEICLYLSPALYQDSYLHLTPFDSFFYGDVLLFSGDRIIITCLSIDSWKDFFLLSKNITKKKRLIPSIILEGIFSGFYA